MDISEISDEAYCEWPNVSDNRGAHSELNGRKVNILSVDEHQTGIRIANSRLAMRPMMSRPDRVDIDIRADYNDKRSGSVEGKISISWEKPKPAPESPEKKIK